MTPIEKAQPTAITYTSSTHEKTHMVPQQMLLQSISPALSLSKEAKTRKYETGTESSQAANVAQTVVVNDVDGDNDSLMRTLMVSQESASMMTTTGEDAGGPVAKRARKEQEQSAAEDKKDEQECHDTVIVMDDYHQGEHGFVLDDDSTQQHQPKANDSFRSNLDTQMR